MTVRRSLTPWSLRLACDHGVQHGRAATVLDERESMPSEFGKAARMFTSRTFFGIEQRDMATLLKVRLSTYQRWENGRDPIPAGIWTDVEALFDKFDAEVSQMVSAAEDADEVVRVRVWRSRNEHHPFPAWWARVVGEALRRTENLEPVFPEDDKDE